MPEDADLPDRIVPTSSHDRCRPVGEAVAGQGARASFQDSRLLYQSLRLIIYNSVIPPPPLFPHPTCLVSFCFPLHFHFCSYAPSVLYISPLISFLFFPSLFLSSSFS